MEERDVAGPVAAVAPIPDYVPAAQRQVLEIWLQHASRYRVAAGPTAAELSAQIDESGARAVLAELYGQQDEWSKAMAGIASGEPAWLLIAVRLKPVTDGGSSQELTMAVGEALEHEPANVLAITVPAFTVSEVCMGADVDDARYDSYDLASRAVDRRKRAVEGVVDPDLRQRRQECISSLEASKRGLAQFFGVPPAAMAPNNSLERTRER